MARTHFVKSLGSALLVFALYALIIVVAARKPSVVLPASQVVDYRVLACAERAVLAGRDPYLTEPLRSCEHRLAPEAGEPEWSATPFALPPYSAFVFLPFGVFGFALGRVLWYLLLLAALVVTCAAVAAIVRRPTVGVALVLVPALGGINLFYGESVLLAIAALALAAWARQRERLELATIALCFAMIEPAIGLPAAVAAFCWQPRMRRGLAIGALVLAAAGVAALGLGANLDYLLHFLPAHGHSEIFARDQYSLTRLAYVLGVPERGAALLGSLSYLATIGLGVVAGRRLAATMGMPALELLVPVAISMLGGPFVHDYEMLAALLAAVVMARDSTLARIAVALMSVVWADRWQLNVVPAAFAAAGIALLYLPPRPALGRLAYAAGTTIALVCAVAAMPKSPPHAVAIVGSPVPPIADGDVSSVPWEWRIRLTPRATAIDRANSLQKVPYWIALLVLPFALNARRRTVVRVEMPRARRADSSARTPTRT